MNIQGLGQYNPQSSIETSRAVSQGSEFEAALQKAYNDGDKTKLKEVCTEFETLLLKNLYQQMKATVPKDDFIGDSNAQNIFQDMLDDELMNKSSQRGVGIADMMYKQLSAQMDNTYKAAEEESGNDETTETTPNGAESVAK